MYSHTAARRQGGERPRSNLFVAPAILKSLWEPMKVRHRGVLNPAWSGRTANIAKSSAAHIKEGLIYESRAVVWNNPLKPVLISGWGYLNNISGAGMKNYEGAYSAKVSIINASIKSHINSKFSSTTESDASRKKRIAAYRISNPQYKELSKDLLEKGHEMLRVLLKRGGYFIAPKLATVELRQNLEIFLMGKGDNYIELDGLIYDKNKNKFIIIELKKGHGKKGHEEAQQMRKAAALLRKWTYEILGKVPDVELVFAGGFASTFNKSGFEYNSEKNQNVQNFSPSQIQRKIAATPNHIVYIRTPVHLLLGFGMANFLRIDPTRAGNIMNTLANSSSGFNKSKSYLSGFRSSDNKFLKYLYSNNKATRKVAAKNAVSFSGPDLYLNIKKFALNNPDFMSTIPEHWRPQVKNNPPDALARVAEGLLYIKALENKLMAPKKPLTINKRDSLLRDLVSYHKLLLSDKYSIYLNNSARNSLTTNLQKYGGARVALAPSPKVNRKYYSRLLGVKEKIPSNYYSHNKNTGGRYKTKSLPTVGLSKVRPGGTMAEYNYGKKPAYNIGNNITAANVASMSPAGVLRRLSVIERKVVNIGTQREKNKALKFANLVARSYPNAAIQGLARKALGVTSAMPVKTTGVKRKATAGPSVASRTARK
jgi:hypothetical protein